MTIRNVIVYDLGYLMVFLVFDGDVLRNRK